MFDGITYSLMLIPESVKGFNWTAIIIVALVGSVLAACAITFFQMKKKYLNEEEQPESKNKRKRR